MRVELRQGRGLVGNLAGLLGDPVELAEIAGAHSRNIMKRADSQSSKTLEYFGTFGRHHDGWRT